ncbi:MAG TPA: hypothetical protein VH370_11275 [Humisphaera sp.]|nr:hypothetical protein [Humisphaera sp.]
MDKTKLQYSRDEFSAGPMIAPIAATLGALAVGLAIHQLDGEYTPHAILLVTVALVCAVVSVGCSVWVSRLRLRESTAPLASRSRKRLTERASERDFTLTVTLLAALLIQFAILFWTWPAGIDQTIVSPQNRAIYLGTLAIAALLVILGITRIRFLQRWWFAGLLIVHLLLSIWMIRSSPTPHIDVWVFQQQGADGLLRGINPYVADQIKYPDIYHSTQPGRQEVYGPGMSKDDQLQFGFPYPPLSLLLATLGYKLAGDIRYAQAAAHALGGFFIGYARRGIVPKHAAAMLLFTPRILFIVGRAWTEPFVVMLLAAVIFCAARKSRWLPIALGLFLASKQYLIFAVPLTFLLLRDPFDPRSRASWMSWLRLLFFAAIVAAVVTLPLALRDWRQCWFSLFTVQQKAPFRWDALSYQVYLGLRNSDYLRRAWMPFLPFVATLLALAWSMWKAPRTAGGVAAALALVYLTFFAFNKQAFCNYYFFAIGALCCAIAMLDAERPALPGTATTSNPHS